MKLWNRWLSALLALAMLLTSCPSLAEAAPAAQAQAVTLDTLDTLGATAYLHNGRVTFVDGACTEEAVLDMESAERVVDAMLPLLGGDERTRFTPWSTLEDAVGNRYYVFQQVYGKITVPGGAVKVVTDGDGHMLGLIASVASELPDEAEAEGITAEQAEALVKERLREENRGKAELIEGRTQEIILPLKPEIDPDDEEEAKNRFVWAVYTTNVGGGADTGTELPYLAHYVAVSGEYLYCLPTILPGDQASTAGAQAAYAFEFMEPAEYTGNVKLSDGTEREITVTLMRDSRTGMYYLGNIERRIAVADCYQFLYESGRVALEASRDNTGWDNTCLLALYNYCRAWDYYRAIGWIGGDGVGTPILILKDFCNRDHEPIDNAAYAGKYYGWQVFLSSDANDYAQCLDVLAHEFTHCVTGSVMTSNAYMNDYGAINEAMSDIQGNICEMLAGATEDTAWLLGENSRDGAIRSMSDPLRYHQPAYAWDIYYMPAVKDPTAANDRGGVHTNSSLLNNVAYRLCTDGGMTLEEARAFWFAVDCAMVPGTDYAQLSELMPWVLKRQGMEQYAPALRAALDATRLYADAVPEKFDSDRALVTVTLPDREGFNDGNWMLMIVTVDFEEIAQRVQDMFARRGKAAGLLDELMTLLGLDPALLPTEEEIAQEPDTAWNRLIGGIVERAIEALFGAGIDGEERETSLKELAFSALKLVKKYFGDTVYSGMTAAGQDGHTVRMVCQPGATLPLLFRLEVDSDEHLVSAGLLLYVVDTWIDLGAVIAPAIQEASERYNQPEADEMDTKEYIFSLLNELFSADGLSGEDEQEPSGEEAPGWLETFLTLVDLLSHPDTLRDLLLYRIRPGEINEIPDNGIDAALVLDTETFPALKDLFSAEQEADGGNKALADLKTVEVKGAKGEISERKVRKKYAELTKQLIRQRRTVTTMESCTAGQIASLITDAEGSSAVIKGAFVTYSNEAKIQQGVDADVIETYGVYSAQTAAAMAEACRKAYGADIGVGVTGSFGNADPNNADSEPGEVYFAIATSKGTTAYHCTVPKQSSRLSYKLYTADVIADQLR